ncbi:MAG: hypothetical protein ACLPX9_00660, partial [Rhodomicrobium sp.]
GMEIGCLVVLDEGMAVDLQDRPARLCYDGLPVRIHNLVALAANGTHPFILKPQPLCDRRLALFLRPHQPLMLNQTRAVRGMGIALSPGPPVLGGKLAMEYRFLPVHLLQLVLVTVQLLLLLLDLDLIAMQFGRFLSLALLFPRLLGVLRLRDFMVLVSFVLALVLLLARLLSVLLKLWLLGVLRSLRPLRRLRTVLRLLRAVLWLLLLALRLLVFVFLLRCELRQDNRRVCGARHPRRHNERHYGGQEERHGLDR